MSTTYNTTAGDTFEAIARRVYGTEQEALRLQEANPGASEPLTAGVVLVVPDLPGAPLDQPQQAPAKAPNEVAVLIEGLRFRFWQSIRITRAIDATDTMELVAPFDADSSVFRDTFRPFSYKSAKITVGGVPLFTGTMVGVVPVVDPKRKVVSVSAYSLPGVLNDCTAPASAFNQGGNKLEFQNQNLRDIAKAAVGFFGLSVVFNDDPGAVFELETLGAGKKILPFLTNLAKQRGLVMSSTQKGELLFLKSTDAGSPVAKFRQGASPLLSVMPFFSPQEYYSHLTGVEPVLVGLRGSQFTVRNSRLVGVIRPITFDTSDVVGGEVKAAVEAKAGRMFGNAASYSVTLATWRDPAGKLWEPNSTVTLTAPNAMIYKEYAFIVRSVEFIRERASETAILNLVIPGSFSGKIPEALPWDG